MQNQLMNQYLQVCEDRVSAHVLLSRLCLLLLSQGPGKFLSHMSTDMLSYEHTCVHTPKERTSFLLYPLYWTKSPFTTFRFSLRLWQTRSDKLTLPSFLASLNLDAIKDHNGLQVYYTYMNIYFQILICLCEILKSQLKTYYVTCIHFRTALT